LKKTLSSKESAPSLEAKSKQKSKQRGSSMSQTHKLKKILIVEDHPTFRELLRTAIQDNGITVFIASSGNEAVRLYGNFDFDLVVTDIHMPDGDGYAVLEALSLVNENLPAIVLTSEPEKFAASNPYSNVKIISKRNDFDTITRQILYELQC
jgi:CheY-like chemotaxis protein